MCVTTLCNQHATEQIAYRMRTVQQCCRSLVCCKFKANSPNTEIVHMQKMSATLTTLLGLCVCVCMCVCVTTLCNQHATQQIAYHMRTVQHCCRFVCCKFKANSPNTGIVHMQKMSASLTTLLGLCACACMCVCVWQPFATNMQLSRLHPICVQFNNAAGLKVASLKQIQQRLE